MTEQDIFVRQAANNLRFWLGRTRDLSEQNLPALAEERDNLRRAAAWALAFPALHHEVALLLHQSLRLVELRGYWQQWIPLLEQASTLVTDTPVRAQLLSDFGFCLRLNDELDAAIAVFEAAAQAAEATANHELLGEIHFHLATTYREARSYDEARRFARSASTLFLESDSATPRRQGAVANLVGLIERHEGHNEAAADRFTEAILVWDNADEHAYLARALQNRGAALTDLGSFAQALADLDRALTLSPHPLVSAEIHINRGNIFYFRKEWQPALGAYTLAWQLAEAEQSTSRQQAMAETNIAHIYMEIAQLEPAEHYLREAVALWQRLEDEVMLANALGTLAEVEAAQERNDEARQHLQEALRLVDEYPADAFARQLRESFLETLSGLNGGQKRREPGFEV